MAAVDGADLGGWEPVVGCQLGGWAAVGRAFFFLSGGCLGAVWGLFGGCLGGCRGAVWGLFGGLFGGLSGGCFLPAVSLPRADSKNNNKPPPCKQPTAAL